MREYRTRWLILFIVLILAAGCLCVPCYFIYANSKDIIVDELGNNAIDIAVAISAFIEKDIDEYDDLPAQSFTPPEDSPQPEESGTPSSSVGSGSYDSGYYDGYYDGYNDGYDGYDYAYGDTALNDPNGANNGGYGAGYLDGYADGYDDGAYDYEYGYEYDNVDSYSDGSLNSAPETKNAAGNGVSSSTSPHPASTGSSTYNEAYFSEIIIVLEKIQHETGAAKIYTEKKLSDTKKGYVFKEGYVPESRLLSSDLTEQEILAFNEGVNSSTDVLQDESLGEYIRGYAPIFDGKTGGIVGAVVVEFTLADAINLSSEVLALIISCFVALTLLATVVVYRLILSRMKYRSKDVLTELCNKRYFEKRLKREIRYARNMGRALSLIMIDIDMFKGVNDNLGHQTGDMVLKAVSGMLLKCTRRGDICCRYGGDEFIIILPGTDRMQAAAIAERIRQEVGLLRFESAGGPVGVTLSVGVAELDNGMTADKFKETADKTLYYSKNTGKNRITVYNNAQNINI